MQLSFSVRDGVAHFRLKSGLLSACNKRFQVPWRRRLLESKRSITVLAIGVVSILSILKILMARLERGARSHTFNGSSIMSSNSNEYLTPVNIFGLMT